jgi:hypothetical protein
MDGWQGANPSAHSCSPLLAPLLSMLANERILGERSGACCVLGNALDLAIAQFLGGWLLRTSKYCGCKDTSTVSSSVMKIGMRDLVMSLA